MQITPGGPGYQAFFTALDVRLGLAYDVAPIVYDKIATTVPMGTEFWTTGWIGQFDKMREWLGSRVTRTPAPQTYTVQVQNWELTEQIDLFKLADDQHGIYNQTAENLGTQMKKLPDYQVRDLLLNQGSQTGARQKCLDALTYFNSAHPVDFYDASKGTYSNDLKSGGTTISGILTGGGLAVNSFATVWQYMAGLVSESGESLGLVPSHLLHAPQLKATADTILNTQFFGAPVIGNLGTGTAPNYAFTGSTENTLKGWSDRIMWNDLAADPNTWYQTVLNRSIRPWLWLQHTAPNFVLRNSPQDPAVFDTHSVLYGSMARATPAWSFPWLCVRSGP